MAAVAGSVGLLVGFTAGLFVASTGTEGRHEAASPRPPAVVSATPAVSATRPARAPATTVDPGAHEAQDSFHLDLRSQDSRSRLASGFYGAEGLDTASPSIWSQGTGSTISLPLNPGPGDYTLVLTARTLASIAPLSVAFSLNGKELDKVSIKGVPGTFEVAVPRSALKAGSNELVLSYPRTAKPAATLQGTKDTRDLALNLFGLDLRPK